jgi:hypothetical protein
MKMPKKNSSKKNDPKSSAQSSSLAINRCCFETSDGRRCRMVRSATHPTLCLFHARDEQQRLESHRLGAEISNSLTGDFMTATDVNHVLGKLFTALAQNRISRRNAATLAYIGHLMLSSLPGIKKEYNFCYDFETWQGFHNRSTRLSNSDPAALAVAPNRPAGSQNDPPTGPPQTT